MVCGAEEQAEGGLGGARGSEEARAGLFVIATARLGMLLSE